MAGLILKKMATLMEYIYYTYIHMNQLPGIISLHSKRTFVSPQSISVHLHCSICTDVFEDPVRTICGHTFCYICIQHWAALKKHCPVCKRQISARKLENDLLAIAMVDDLRVKCYHAGCNWEGVESIRKKHQRCCLHKPKNQELPTYTKFAFVEVSDLDEKEEIEINDVEIISNHSHN